MLYTILPAVLHSEERAETEGHSNEYERTSGFIVGKKQVINYYEKKRGLREVYSMTKGSDATKEMIKLQGLEKYNLKS